MSIIKKISKKATAAMAALLIVMTVVFSAGFTVSAAQTGLTGTGLAEFGLKAYRDGWQYNYGSYGEKNSSGVRQSDCSGLIYAYLCWNGDDSDPVHDYSMPRGATSQYKACSETGSTSTIPRTHGLLLFNKTSEDNCDHVGIYVGNDMSVDNSTYGVNMRYRQASTYTQWNTWGKLDSVSYPTNGWYEFDGSPYYYVDGQYVIDTTKTIDGVNYSFDSSGVPSPKPSGYEDGSSGDSGDNVSVTAKTTADVNLRTGTSLSSSVITVVPNGTSVTITNKDNSEWYKVKLSNGTTGYIYSQYLSTSSDSDSSDKTFTAVTTTDVNLRSGQSTDSSVITVLDKGTSLTVLSTANSSWYKVRLSDNRTGYIYSSYLKKSTDTQPTEPSDTGDSYSAKTTTYVNLRTGAGTNTSVITVVDSGTTLTVTDSSNSEWHKVKLSDGTTGYIYSQYLSKVSSSSTPDSGSGSSFTAKTTAYVNLRTGTGTNTSVITVIDSGTTVTVTDNSNSEWYKVKLSDGTTGYIFSQYLQGGSSSDKARTTDYVNFRSGPSLNDSVMLVVDTGTSVTILDKSNSEWYKVQLSSGKTGYIYSKYLA